VLTDFLSESTYLQNVNDLSMQIPNNLNSETTSTFEPHMFTDSGKFTFALVRNMIFVFSQLIDMLLKEIHSKAGSNEFLKELIREG